MNSELFLRIADALLALFWAGVLIQTLHSGHVGHNNNRGIPTRRSRPGLYWFALFIFALMVLHFAGLAVVGQAA